MANFEPAVRKRVKLRMAIAGPAGSGKTYSALQIASGLGGKIGFIDTEHNSAHVYAEQFDYEVALLEEPYDAAKYIQYIKEAQDKYDVLIVDSLSHSWTGPGGILSEVTRYAEQSKSGNTFAAWVKPSAKHEDLKAAILGCHCHLICTLRSKISYAQTTGEDGRTRIQTLGMQPIQRTGIEYEFMVYFMLTDEHYANPVKDVTQVFTEPFIPGEDTGLKLLEWLEGGEPMPEPERLSLDQLKEALGKLGKVAEITKWMQEIKTSADQLPEEEKKELRELIKARKQEIINPKGKEEKENGKEDAV